MLHYPGFNPVALQLGPLQVHWYGLMYLVGFASAWLLALVRARKQQPPWSSTEISDLIFYAALGVLLGGRVGYMFFYDFPELLAHPLSLFKVWEGGMSFHGGLLGVLLSMTTANWGMLFPGGGPLPRHPSQLYELLLEGLLLFIIIWLFSTKPRPRMATSGLFALCYGILRFSVEFFREPDAQLGFIGWQYFTMGQLLSLPMIIAGVILLILAYRPHH